MPSNPPEFLTTRPGTQLSLSGRVRRRPCWLCRIRVVFRRRPWHWSCQLRELYPLTYLKRP